MWQARCTHTCSQRVMHRTLQRASLVALCTLNAATAPQMMQEQFKCLELVPYATQAWSKHTACSSAAGANHAQRKRANRSASTFCMFMQQQ